MARVFEHMELDYSSHNVDDIRSRIKVTEVVTEEQAAVDEAKAAKGEETEKKPTQFLVSFTAEKTDYPRPKQFAGDVYKRQCHIVAYNLKDSIVEGTV